MPIRVTCPYCGFRSIVDDQFIGQSGPCVNCGQLIAIPRPAAPTPPAPPGALPEPALWPSPAAFPPPGPAAPLPHYAPLAPPSEQPGPKPKRRSKGALHPVLIMFGIGGGGLLAILAVVIASVILLSQRAEARRSISQEKLRQVGFALLNYHNDFHCFPPAFMEDSQGQPSHSWRVLILPYLDGQDAFALYDFRTAWNGSGKGMVATQMPAPFKRFEDQPNYDYHTNIVVMTGPGFIFQGSTPTRLTDVSDGPVNTILALEVDGHNIQWLEPRDLTEADLHSGIIGPSGDGINVVMADGSARFIDLSNVTADRLRPLLTMAAGDSPPD